MKTLMFTLFLGLTFNINAQETIKLPGESGKSYKIAGTFMGEMIRSSGGVDQKKERYFLALDNNTLTIWKHVILLLEDNKTYMLTKTTVPVADIDWDYFDSDNGEGPTEKKVAGKPYYTFSINAMRGKRFQQEKYLKEEPSNVTVGNLQIQVNDQTQATSFFARVKAAKH